MLTKSFAEISRRRFLAAGSISVAAAWLHPRALFARPGDDLVESALKQAAKHEKHRSKTSPQRQCSSRRGWKYRGPQSVWLMRNEIW
jgi:hypothetical protein